MRKQHKINLILKVTLVILSLILITIGCERRLDVSYPMDTNGLVSSVRLVNGEPALFVNGQHLATAEDDTYSGGDIALAAVSYEEAATKIAFDNLVVYGPTD